ncbi:MAG TPA: TAT-variant-translocated molybdopterin oxidoreductase, partial [Ardenticatenaceae bacterium]|nr:TAT-variant-translocated molybdopterin oxidoreductase [Ardenticatenaceae bacterium]
MISKKSLDFAAIRARLANARGKTFWRSLEELAETKEFREFLHDEFPRQVMLLSEPIDRRQALKLLGASLALAGLAGCNSNQRDLEEIVPYVEAPERIVPGKPLFFATTMALGGVGLGLLAESHMGRPIKVEGNPDHPGSLGFTDVFAQGSVLTLYDPDRSQAVTNQGRIRTWDNFLAEFRSALDAQRGAGGVGVRILTETVTSPTLAAQIQEILGLFPEARWHQYEPISADNAAAGARLAFGEDVHTVYRFDQANVVLSLDADFLACFPANVRYVHDFSNRRRVTTEGETAMSRLYAVESTHTNTGAKADHRLRVRSSDVEAVARAVAGRLGVAGLPASSVPETVRADVIDLLVRDLDANRGASIVIAGQNQPPIVHALAHAINDALGNAGTTVIHTEPLQANPVDQIASLGELVADMAGGRVEILVIIGGNPVSTAPADLPFGQALENVGLRVHLSLYEDETSALCHWHIPEAHFLEAWGDARAFDGTVSIVQPLIAPLYGGRSAHEMLAAFGDNPSRTGLEIVRAFWQTQYQPTLETPFQGDFERFWRRILHDGVIPNTALPAREVALQADELGAAGTPGAAEGGGLEIVFRPDPTIFDGRFANNAWLQELPKPITKLVWDNAAMVSPATAQQLGVAEEQLVELRLGGRTVRAPIWVMPGHADNSVTVHLGYGRRQAGGIGSGTGFDAYALRTSGAPWISTGLEIAPTGEQYSLVTTQPHHSMEGRHIVRAGTLEEYRENPGFAQEQEHGIEAAHPDEHGQEGV